MMTKFIKKLQPVIVLLLIISWCLSGWPQKIQNAQASTALTIYETNTAATTLTTTNQLTNSAPSSEVTNITIKVGTHTGWDTLPSQGSTSNWASGTSEPAQLGTGFLWDVTTLEGQQILSGNWTPKVKLSVSNGSVVADIHVRVAVRSSGGVYTNIIDAASTGQTINTTATVYTLPATSGTLTNFNTGDKLYQDVILNVTTNSTGKATATFTEYENGGANESVVTPGYQAQPAAVLSWNNAPATASFSIWAGSTPTSNAVLTWANGTKICETALSDNNNQLNACGTLNKSQKYRIQMILKNTGGTAANMNGATSPVDQINVKAHWAGSNPTIAASTDCGFRDFNADDGATTCNVAFNATNNVRITNTGAGNAVIGATTGTEGFMYLITIDTDIPISDPSTYASASISTVTQASSRVSIGGVRVPGLHIRGVVKIRGLVKFR